MKGRGMRWAQEGGRGVEEAGGGGGGGRGVESRCQISKSNFAGNYFSTSC